MRLVVAVAAALAVSLPSLAVAGAEPALATTRSVGPGQSIQAAVDRAAPGDTIVVRGRHAENVEITKDGLHLIGRGAVLVRPTNPKPGICQGPPDSRDPRADFGFCITGQASGSSGEVRDVAVAGFTIEGFIAAGIGVRQAQNTVIYGNDISQGISNGVLVGDSTNTVIAFNRIHDNFLHGIFADQTANLGSMVGNDIWNNSDGVVVEDGQHGLIDSNHIYENCVGIVLYAGGEVPDSDLTVHANLLNDNGPRCSVEHDGIAGESGAGVVLLGGHDITVADNWISDNTPDRDSVFLGGVLLAESSSVFGGYPNDSPHDNTVTGNVIIHNQPDLAVAPGTTNTVASNYCLVSQPAGLC